MTRSAPRRAREKPVPIHQPAIDEQLPFARLRCQQTRQGNRGAHGIGDAAFPEPDLAATEQIRGDAGEWQGKSLKSWSTKWRSKKAISLSPLISPPRAPTSKKLTTSCQVRAERTQPSSRFRSPLA